VILIKKKQGIRNFTERLQPCQHHRCSRKLLQTSSLWTVCCFFSVHPSVDHRSIELCVVSFNVAPHKMSATAVAFSDGENMHFRSTASTALRNPLLTLSSRRPFEHVFLLFCRRRTRPHTRPSPCADLAECNSHAVHRELLLYTVINVSDCTLSCLPFCLPHAADLPAVLQLGVAKCQDFTPQPTPFLSLTFGATLSSRAPGNSFKRRHCGRSAASSPSIGRSSIDRTLRLNFQRRSTQNVGDLSGFFPTVKTCISATPIPPPFSIHCSP
jgi:hypothetical protein